MTNESFRNGPQQNHPCCRRTPVGYHDQIGAATAHNLVDGFCGRSIRDQGADLAIPGLGKLSHTVGGSLESGSTGGINLLLKETGVGEDQIKAGRQ
jgi:hypothetical protein